MIAEELYKKLKPLQETRGYFFNPNKEKTMELIESLLKNKERYGYMACPCRLASEDRAHDKDIICPCEYRAPDVEEFGACYCALYVSQKWIDNKQPHDYVPERRPPEKLFL